MHSLFNFDKEKLFFTSDLHFDHFNICSYCERPFSNRKEMNEALINNWNSVVPSDGVVVCCGDFMLQHKIDVQGYLKKMSKLNGNILLCRGNHDMIPLSSVKNKNLIAVVDIANIDVDGKRIMASHYPMMCFPGDYQVFGHIHTLKDGKVHGLDSFVPDLLSYNQYDVGVDQNNYKPISYFELMDIFSKRKNEKISNNI